MDAILIGAQTAIDDDPALTVRLSTESLHAPIRHPIRFVLDGQGRVPLQQKLFTAELPGETHVLTTRLMPEDKEKQLRDLGVHVTRLPALNGSWIDPDAIVSLLGQQSVQSLLLEGGQAVLGSFLDHGLIDEVWAFLAPMLIGGKDATAAIGGTGAARLEHAIRLVDIRTESVGDDLLICGQVKSATESSRSERHASTPVDSIHLQAKAGRD